jgi:hypothetical protein
MCSGCCEREELTFSNEEIDTFLLKKLRRGTGCKESHDSPSTVSIPFLPSPHTPPPVPEVVEAIFYRRFSQVESAPISRGLGADQANTTPSVI